MSLDRRGKYHSSTGSPQRRTARTPGKRTLTESMVAPAAGRRIQTAPAAPRGPATPAALARAVAPPSSAGERMPDGVQTQMEQALGADFSAVRIHVGPQAQAIGARAYAQGTDVHFAPGQYQPDSLQGQELLGHELTHVMQQAQGRVSAPHQAKGGSIHNDPALEREADERGASAARRKPAHRDPAVPGDTLADAEQAPATCATCGGQSTGRAQARRAGIPPPTNACPTCGKGTPVQAKRDPAAPIQADTDDPAPELHDIEPPEGHDERMARLDQIDQELGDKRVQEASIQAQLDELGRIIPATPADQQARDEEAERLGTELESTQGNEIDLLDEEISTLDTSVAAIEGLSLERGTPTSIDHWHKERDRLQAQRKQADKDKWHVPLQRQRARARIREIQGQLNGAPLSSAARASLEDEKRGLGEKLADTAQHRKPPGTFLRTPDGRCVVVYQHSVRVNGSLNWRLKNPGSLGRAPSSTQDPPGALAHIPPGDPCGGKVGLFIFSDPEFGRAETRRQVDVAAQQGRFVGEFLLSYSHEGQPYLNLVHTQCPGVNVGTEAGGGKDGDRLSQANKEAVKRGILFAESGSAAVGDEWTCDNPNAPADMRALLGCDE